MTFRVYQGHVWRRTIQAASQEEAERRTRRWKNVTAVKPCIPTSQHLAQEAAV